MIHALASAALAAAPAHPEPLPVALQWPILAIGVALIIWAASKRGPRAHARYLAGLYVVAAGTLYTLAAMILERSWIGAAAIALVLIVIGRLIWWAHELGRKTSVDD